LLANPTVDGYGREHASATVLRGIDERCAIRCEARALILTPVRQHLDRFRGQIDRRDPEVPPIEVHDGEPFAVRRQSRTGVVPAFERHAPGTIRLIDVDLVDLRTARAIGHEVDLATVRRPRW